MRVVMKGVDARHGVGGAVRQRQGLGVGDGDHCVQLGLGADILRIDVEQRDTPG